MVKFQGGSAKCEGKPLLCEGFWTGMRRWLSYYDEGFALCLLPPKKLLSPSKIKEQGTSRAKELQHLQKRILQKNLII